MASKKNSGTGAKLAFLGALVAAAAGTYYVYHNKGAQKQLRKFKGWALKAKGEVLEKLEKFKEVDEEMYQNVVDTVMKKYKSVKSIQTGELADVSKELKSHWNNIKKELSSASKTTKKSAASMANKVKKAVTK